MWQFSFKYTNWIKYIPILIIIFLTIKCEEDKNDIILGEWRLIEIYGVKADLTPGWITIIDSPIQTIKFNLNGEYILATDGNIKCKGKYMFESSSTLRLSPDNCLLRIESVETIYKLTHDTLIISAHISILSSGPRKEKYIRYD